VQKFTRSITREIELAGTRLALTLGETGLSVRPVGTRRPPWEMSWATLVCHLVDKAPRNSEGALPEEVSAAVDTIKTADAPKRLMPEPAVAPPSTPPVPPLPPGGAGGPDQPM
jgi:hypothetical protein